MKKIGVLFLLLVGFLNLILSHNAFALGRKPKHADEDTIIQAPKQPVSQRTARDMQVATGEIPTEENHKG